MHWPCHGNNINIEFYSVFCCHMTDEKGEAELVQPGDIHTHTCSASPIHLGVIIF